ncbi:MAG: hypothetical protein LH613_11790 [Chamaesiphon sp.]|nr:hypothetical protein [Chamaesiphon sp.]
MNHNPSDDSAKVPPSGQAVVVGTASMTEHSESYHLNPALQQALGCLDLKLEDELMRFRATEDRDRAIESVPGNTGWGESVFEAESEILTAIIVEPAMSGTIVEEQPERGLNSQRSVTDALESPTGFIIIDGLSTSTNSHQAPANVNYAPIALYRDVLPEHLDLNFSSAGEIAPFHDEYLSSSQELLRQTQSGYSQPAAPVDNHPQSKSPTPKPKNLTALKIGAVAAACLLAGGAVYTYLNPSILAPLTATMVSPTATTASSLGQLIQSPNLAANEFTELNLSTLNTVKLPTTMTTNVTMATTPTMTAITPGISTTPVAIPFNSAAQVISPTTVITSQPKLADSLIKSLLPPNYQSFARQSSRTTLPGVKR